MQFAEQLAIPTFGQLFPAIPRNNDFRELFFVRPGEILFDVFWGVEVNLKVLLKIYRSDGTRELFLVDTDPYDVGWNFHRRKTRSFFIHAFPKIQGRVNCVKVAFIIHFNGRSISSEFEYIYMDWHHFDQDWPHRRGIDHDWKSPNDFRTYEADPYIMQRDSDWFNNKIDDLQITPKFTKGNPGHPFHPQHYIHQKIDKTIEKKRQDSAGFYTIKVCIDCIDDTNFVNHLIYASENDVHVQCIVDWRKMTLTNSLNYNRLKHSRIELIGIFCSAVTAVEVAPDMHAKFIIFGYEDCIIGSFNITFERWWANWESGMTFCSEGVCRLLDNVFQSIRGGVVQSYGVDPFSHFNLLYTFGSHHIANGKYYRPNEAVISEIHRARHSIRVCLFLIGEMHGEHGDSVVDALIHAKNRGVDVHIILNGHMSRCGDPGVPRSLQEELHRPLIPAVGRLKYAGIPVALIYGQHDHYIPYSPIHAKYCVIDEWIALDGSFNWYNTSNMSHDLLAIAANHGIAKPYLYEFYQILREFRSFY